ncbi:MAG: SUMF1/EgtB/PvdO family nonheme iron enzyme, partial [Casimicrobiaceae bacterium]
AHVAWFDEWFCLRGGGNLGPARQYAPYWPEADAWLDSSRIPHPARWALPALTLERVSAYLERIGEEMEAALAHIESDDRALEPSRLAFFHQAMHLEALAWLAQTLAWPAPAWVREPKLPSIATTVVVPRCDHAALDQDEGFLFDNEIGATCTVNTPVRLTPLVRMDAFARWVDAGGYSRATGQPSPPYWRPAGNGGWEHRRFDCWRPCEVTQAVVHVSAHAAEAFCRDHGGRLPTEDELWVALSGRASAQLADAGLVWEWTSSVFSPYTGFKPSLYRAYSAPSFDGRHRVLKGGSFAAPSALHHPRFRNFFRPERADVFAGFRLALPV